MSEEEIAQLGADTALGIHSAILLTSELLGLLLEPVRRTADRLTVVALVADAESTVRRAERRAKTSESR